MDAYIDSRIAGITGAFSDPRVFLATPLDDRVSAPPPIDSTYCHAQQSEDGPTYLIIGSNVSDGSLLRASERFGIPLQDLMAFRATNVDITKLPVWRPALEVINPDGAHKFEVLSEPMPMLEAREIAEKAMASRDDVVSASVRRCADVAHGVARQAALS